MAVEDKYINTNLAAGKKAEPALFNGAEALQIVATFEVAVADDDGSIFRFANVQANLIPVDITITNDTITGGTDYDVGIYLPLAEGGAEVTSGSSENLAVTLDLSSARAEGSGITGLSALDLADATNRLYTIAGETQTKNNGSYDLALTGLNVHPISSPLFLAHHTISGLPSW